MKLGLIGGGYWGKNLVRDFNNCKVLDIICDLNIDLIKDYNKKYPSVRTTTDFKDILNDEKITAVCIALPAELHYKFSKMLLLANKDVYVEKPITLDIKEAEELIKLAKDRNKILMVGHLLHYHPCIDKIKEMIKEGKIGNIKNIISNRLNLGKFRQQENVLWSFAPHDISIILNLCDNKLPKSVLCSGKSNITEGIHDITNSILKYDDIYVNINVNWLNPYKEQKLTIIGDKGMILFNDTLKIGKIKYYPEYLKFNDNLVPEPIKNNEQIIEVNLSKSPLLRECEHFIECCNQRKKPITDGNEGLRVLKVLDFLQKSLDNNMELIINENYYSHPTAIIDDGAEIGNGTKIWHFSHICGGARIGKNCKIGQNVYIGKNVILGDNCKVQNNVSIYSGVEAEDYVFFGPSCVLTNDINPRCMYSKNGKYIKTKIETGVTLGANCTIVCGNTLGKHSLIGAGAVICKDVEPNSIMVGNPGKKIGEIDKFGNRKLK